MNKKNKNYPSAEIKLKVSFFDLDPMNIVWHGNYLKYFDQARSALFDKYNINLENYFKQNDYLFPITKTSIKHIMPLRYNDEFICIVKLIEAKYKLVMSFEIHLLNDNKICVKGKSEQVTVKSSTWKILYKIPEYIRSSFGLTDEE